MRCDGTVGVEINFRGRTVHAVVYASPEVEGVLISWHALVDLKILSKHFPLNDEDAIAEGLEKPMSYSEALRRGLIVPEDNAQIRAVELDKKVHFGESERLRKGHGQRSYEILSRGQILIRNRRYIRPFKTDRVEESDAGESDDGYVLARDRPRRHKKLNH